jgi:ABC-type lipoprotein export system ATPase subunit
VLACLGDAVKRAGAAALMVTHSRLAASAADRVLRLAGGKLVPEPR